MTAIEEHYQLIEGVRVHYMAAGEGAPLLLVHGVGGSLLTYERNIAEMARFARVYALDLPGHGFSGVPDLEYLAEQGAAFIVRFIEEVCGAPAALVGNSAGGLMCQIATAERPDLVTHLVLVSSAGFGRDVSWSLRLLTLPGLDRFVEEVTPERVRGSLELQLYDHRLVTPELVEAVYQTWQQPGTRRAFLRGLRSNISLLGLRRLRRYVRSARVLAVPVLIVWGHNDRIIPVKHAYRAAKWIAGARLHVFKRCGHMPSYEHAHEFNQIVREFLA